MVVAGFGFQKGGKKMREGGLFEMELMPVLVWYFGIAKTVVWQRETFKWEGELNPEICNNAEAQSLSVIKTLVVAHHSSKYWCDPFKLPFNTNRHTGQRLGIAFCLVVSHIILTNYV